MLKIWKFEPHSNRPIWKTESRLESPQRKKGWGAVIYSGSRLSFVSKAGTLKNWRQQAQYDIFKRPVTLVKLKTKDKNQISLMAENSLSKPSLESISRIKFEMQELFFWLYYLWFFDMFLDYYWSTLKH